LTGSVYPDTVLTRNPVRQAAVLQNGRQHNPDRTALRPPASRWYWRNAYLRWAFGEAAVICKRNHPLLTPYADRLIAKRGKFKGNAILAAKLARAAYFMLQQGAGRSCYLNKSE
jgi:hypothetical protein